MSTFASSVRVTTKCRAVWRACRRCAALAPLAPDEDICKDCRRKPVRGRRPARKGRA